MPRNGPHPLAIFSLVPINDRAREVLKNTQNAHLVSSFGERGAHETTDGLDIGPHIGSKSRYTLATIGRNGDVLVEGEGISRIQCSFEIHEGNMEIMLQDRSSNKSTQFFGETAMPFEPERAYRRVVMDRDTNLHLGFGGNGCDLYQFRIAWHNEPTANSLIGDREDNPSQTRTILDEQPTIAPSQSITRIHTPSTLEMRIRYSKREKIGSGSYGEVWKVANVDSGEHLAVKRLKRPAYQSREYLLLKREVEMLSRISHRNVVEFRAAQWENEHFDIFMELKPGNIENMIRDGLFMMQPFLGNTLLQQMLQALDYLASENIIHRDVKPENILYTITSEGYLYQLADFGIANIVDDSRTFAGTSMYMAPELYNSLQTPQTPKMDVWSLFVTLAYAMNAADFQNKQLQLHTTAQRMKAIQEAANEGPFQALRDMAVEDPSQRASAADMLDKLFKGEGRTTPRDQIRATTIRADEAGPSEQRIEQQIVATANQGERGDTRSPKAATAARRQLLGPANRVTKKRLAPGRSTVQTRAVETPVPGPAAQERMRQDVPQLPGGHRGI